MAYPYPLNLGLPADEVYPPYVIPGSATPEDEASERQEDDNQGVVRAAGSRIILRTSSVGSPDLLNVRTVEGLPLSDPIARLPEDLLISILELAASPEASATSRFFYKHIQEISKQAWADLKHNSKTNPTIAAYINEVDAKLPVQKKFQQLYAAMTRGLNLQNLKDRLLDPQLYEELAQRRQDLSLSRAWPAMREAIVVSIANRAENDPNIDASPLPEAGAPVKAIRDWFNDEGNTAVINDIRQLNLTRRRLLNIPDEVGKFTSLAGLCPFAAQTDKGNGFITPLLNDLRFQSSGRFD